MGFQFRNLCACATSDGLGNLRYVSDAQDHSRALWRRAAVCVEKDRSADEAFRPVLASEEEDAGVLGGELLGYDEWGAG